MADRARCRASYARFHSERLVVSMKKRYRKVLEKRFCPERLPVRAGGGFDKCGVDHAFPIRWRTGRQQYLRVFPIEMFPTETTLVRSAL